MSTHDGAPLDADRSEQGRYTQVPSESSLLATSPLLREDPPHQYRFAGSAGRGEGVKIVARAAHAILTYSAVNVGATP